MAIPAESVSTFLAAAGLSLTEGTNLFIGAQIAIGANVPANSVFVRGAPGNPPIRSMGQANEIRYSIVHIRVRWTKFEDGAIKMRAIQDAMQGAAITGVLDVVAMQSEPTVLSQEKGGHYRFGMSFRLVYEDAG